MVLWQIEAKLVGCLVNDAVEPIWYGHPVWFQLLESEGWEGGGRVRFDVPHPDAKKLPLVAGPRAGRWQGLSNYYTPLLLPVGDEALSDAAGLVRAWRKAGVAALDLRPLDADSSWVLELRAALRAGSYWTRDAPDFGNWVLQLDGMSSADYLAARPGLLRTNLHRGQARLSKAGVWGVEVVCESGEALERAMLAYEAVYASSWKPVEGSLSFIRSLAKWMANRGELRLGVLSLNGSPLAAQMWFVHRGVAYIFKLAHVMGCEALSPGTVLTAHLMAHVIDRDRVHSVDFISGDDVYKRDWMSHRRQRMALLAFDSRSARGVWECARYEVSAWRAALKHRQP